MRIVAEDPVQTEALQVVAEGQRESPCRVFKGQGAVKAGWRGFEALVDAFLGPCIGGVIESRATFMQVSERCVETAPERALPRVPFPKTMKIVFLGHRGRDAGGAERSMQLLLSSLPCRVEVTVLLFEDGAYAEELRQRGFAVEILAIDPRILSIKREKLQLWAVFASIAALRDLTLALRRLQPEIVYTNTSKSHVLGALAGRLAGYRVVSHYRDIMSGLALLLLQLIALVCTQRRIAISKAVAKSIWLPNVDVVPNPLDLSQYESLPSVSVARKELNIPRNVPIIAIIGRINRWKGHDRFLRIAKSVAGKSDAHFIIVGKAMFRDDDYPAELRQIAVDLGIEERVHFLPWLDDPRLAYAAIDINCNTSRAEPFGRTIIEAAACGIPTVAFDEGGAPEAISDGVSGRVVKRGDEAAFAEALFQMLAADRDKIAADARKHAKTFDSRLHAERITAILDRVASARRTLR